FVNSQDGRLLPYLSQGFGIVTSAFLSQSEKTIVTYSPSGSIQYWDIQGESRKADFVTNQDLDAITYMQNGVSMVAANKESILHIELVGKRNKDRLRVISSIPLRNVLYTAIVSQNEVAVVSFSETTTIYLWNLQSTYLRKVETNKPLPAKPTSLGYMSGRLFLSFENGTIAAVDTASGQLEFFANHTLIDIDDATINGGTIMLSSNETLIGLRSDYLSRLNEKVTSFTAMQIERPFSGKLGIIPLGTEDFLIYPHEGDSGRIALFSPSKGLYGFYDGYPAPFIKAEARGDKLLTLDINGTVSVIDLKNGTTTFSYTAYGIKTVTFVRDGKIMAGRNRTENMQTSLLLIDPKTGETVAVADENVVSFSLVYDETSDRLYSLGFETRNGRQKTVLKEHSGETYERIETLIAYSGEDVGATLAFDTTRSRLYTSIGYGTVNTFGYGGFTSLEEQNHIPQSLKATNGLLLSLNKDSSLTVWDTQTGRIAMEIYFFKDGGILCMLKGGRIATGG
ncbi:MAG TPA: hypothetical protein PLG43_13805, partial [Spirochaetia bacterium]|nr:hypothetical protein [Spirochaetia bacterium]